MKKRYLTIFEDRRVQYWEGGLPIDLIRAADGGLYDIIDITDPESPMHYFDEGWTDVDRLDWQPELACIDMLRKVQWCGTAHGGYGSTARRCPECKGMHPDDSLNDGGGEYTRGKGHLPDCQLNACICGRPGTWSFPDE